MATKRVLKEIDGASLVLTTAAVAAYQAWVRKRITQLAPGTLVGDERFLLDDSGDLWIAVGLRRIVPDLASEHRGRSITDLEDLRNAITWLLANSDDSR